MTPTLYTSTFGLLGLGFYLTTLFSKDNYNPPLSHKMRFMLGCVLLIWYALEPIMTWHEIASMPQWAQACFLIGTGFGGSAGLLLIKRNAHLVRQKNSA